MQKKEYDYLIVGAGLYGAMFAYSAVNKGKKCLVVDKNEHIGGYCYSEKVHGIEVHKFGAHIFRTDNKKVWDFVNSISEFVPYVNSPIAMCRGVMYNLPFNMNTYRQVWNCSTPSEASRLVEDTLSKCDSPKNLEEHVTSMIGRTLYRMFIKDYTEKQWGKKCTELPPTIIGRIPVRFTYDNNYYKERYQGIPIHGYTDFINGLLQGSKVIIGTDYIAHREELNKLADKVVYTGPIDEFYNYRFGTLEYRSVKFVHEYMPDVDNYQGNAVVNFTDNSVPYTRKIEHKHFDRFNTCKGTVVSTEYPVDYIENNSPSYPIPTEENKALYAKYEELAKAEQNVIFGGRLAEYRYYSMNDIIEKFV